MLETKVVALAFSPADRHSSALVCHKLNFDISQTAGYYSVLTGLLAGFAFTTLILLITNRLDHKADETSNEARTERFADAQQVLAAAFIGLVLMSLSYAVAAGEVSSSGRSASEEPILGLGFALSGLLVIYSIVLTLDAVYSSDSPMKEGTVPAQNPTAGAASAPAGSLPGTSVALFLRDVLAQWITIVAALYVYLGVFDYESIRYWGDSTILLPFNVLGLVLLAIQAAASFILYPRWSSKPVEASSQSSDKKTKPQASVTALSRRTLAVTFLCAISFGLYEDEGSLCGTAPPILPTACLIVMGLSTLAFTYQLARSRPIRTEITAFGRVKALADALRAGEKETPGHSESA